MDMRLSLQLFRNVQQLITHRDWRPEQLADLRQRQLAALRAVAYRASPFYRDFHAGLYDRPLDELPVLTKRLVMDHFDDVVTDRSIHLDAIRNQANKTQPAPFRAAVTSGSTGEPGVFVFGRDDWAWALAAFVRAEMWAGLAIGPSKRHRVATIGSNNPRHLSHMIGADMRNPWTVSLSLSAADPLAQQVARLNTWQPTFLSGYASALAALAAEQLAGRLDIRPTLVIASGEVMTAEMRHALELAWGHCVHNMYAATETAVIAGECQQRSLHLCDDLLIVENVDEDYHPVPPGRPGDKLLVTVLFNTLQPLIRYELGDRVTLAEEMCACGRPFQVLAAVHGREEEVLVMAAAGGAPVVVHPNIWHDVMDAAYVHAWQIVQRDDGLHLYVSGLGDCENDLPLVEALSRALREQALTVPPIHVHRVANLTRGAGGKLPLIRSEVSAPAAPA